MADHDTSFYAGWGAAIRRISDDWHAHIPPKDRERFSIYLSRLWWAPADPECAVCKGKGRTVMAAREHTCVPVGIIEPCRQCEARFQGKQPHDKHLNPRSCDNCGATERPDRCSGGSRCMFP